MWKALAAASLALVSTNVPAGHRAGSYANPVLDADFPDPTVIRAPDGSYYGYATQAKRGGIWINLQLARSKDLIHWRYIGDALPVKPAWASQTQDFWAPHVSREGKGYILYFSAKPDTSDERHGLCLGVATAASPNGPFRDIGHPLQCGTGFVNIDPMEYYDPATGKHLLYWGSGFEPIKVQELAPDMLSFAPGSAPKNLVSPTPGRSAFPVLIAAGAAARNRNSTARSSFPVLIEGSWVIRHGAYYYLFYSGDNCCGPKANYAVMVARSKSATGPFETLEQVTGKPHSIILEKRGNWIAPGHNSIVTDRSGRDWIVYHAVDSRRPRENLTDELNTRRVMLIDPIGWKAGWPIIDGPSSGPRWGPTP